MQVLRYIRNAKKSNAGDYMANTFAVLAQYKEDNLVTEEQFLACVDDPAKHHDCLLLQCELDPELNVSGRRATR
jgi:hypothetical protein